MDVNPSTFPENCRWVFWPADVKMLSAHDGSQWRCQGCVFFGSPAFLHWYTELGYWWSEPQGRMVLLQSLGLYLSKTAYIMKYSNVFSDPHRPWNIFYPYISIIFSGIYLPLRFLPPPQLQQTDPLDEAPAFVHARLDRGSTTLVGCTWPGWCEGKLCRNFPYFIGRSMVSGDVPIKKSTEYTS